MQLVIDPSWLRPPTTSPKTWFENVKSLRLLITDGDISVTCPKKGRDVAYAQWFEGEHPRELLRYLSEVNERLVEDVALPNGPALVEKVSVQPGYTNQLFADELLNHLGEAAVAIDEGAVHLGVLSERSNWAEESDHVVVEARICCREDVAGEWFEPDDDDEAYVRSFLSLTHASAEALTTCAQYPTALIDRVKFGVVAYWIGKLGGKAEDLNFDVSSALVASMKAMNYHRDQRYAASCLRVMGLIAAGRDGEIDGHEEREGSGAGNPVVKDRNGNTVMRAYLAKKSPDANRLFWVRGVRPTFLNVSGHEGRQALK